MLVLGMHRSGTSAVTRALAALGLDLGGDPLMSATADNPTGHFEVGRLVGLDDQVLDALGGRWSAPPEAAPEVVAALAGTELGDEARELIDEVFADPNWVWKDPRASLLLPFWRSVLDEQPAVVLVTRHPLEVARSLAARDGMAIDFGLALWERYTRTLLRDLEGLAVFVVDFEAVMGDPEPVLAELAAFVVEAGGAAEDIDLTVAAQAFVSAHRHHRVTLDEFGAESAVTDQLISLHGVLAALSGPHASFPRVELGPETPGLQMAFTEHKRLSAFEEQALIDRAELALLQSTVEDLRAEIDRRSEQAGHLAREVLGLRDERDVLTERLIDLETWWPVLNAMRIRRVLHRIFRRT